LALVNAQRAGVILARPGGKFQALGERWRGVAPSKEHLGEGRAVLGREGGGVRGGRRREEGKHNHGAREVPNAGRQKGSVGSGEEEGRGDGRRGEDLK